MLTTCVVHGISDVGNVISSVRLSRDEDLAVVQAEGINEVAPESEKLGGDLNLVCRRRRTFLGTKACSSWLFDPDDVRKIDPCIWILHWLISPVSKPWYERSAYVLSHGCIGEDVIYDIHAFSG